MFGKVNHGPVAHSQDGETSAASMLIHATAHYEIQTNDDRKLMLLEGKTVFVTGGARGQGRAHAVESAREGANVIIIDSPDEISSLQYPAANASDLAQTVRLVEELGRQVLSIEADVRSRAQLEDAVAQGLKKFGQIDCLVANAGIWSAGKTVWELSDEQWNDTIDINLSGVWNSLRAVMPHMVERQSGSIIVTASINGMEPAEYYANYIAAKHGAIGLMKAAALEGAKHGIRCNAISPGAIWTPITDNPMGWANTTGRADGTREETYQSGYGYGPLKGSTFLNPEDIANAGVFLNSDRARAITGIVLPVDSGHLLIPGINLSPIKPEIPLTPPATL